MKKLTVLILALTLILCGCGAGEEAVVTTAAPDVPATAASTEAATEPTTEPTTAPTEPPVLYFNPLNGTPMEEPYNGRVFGFSIGNSKESLPHYGVSRADILFESFVNGLTTRRFALYTDISQVDAVGGSRSMRMQFTDMCQAYDAIGVYAGGSSMVMGDLRDSNVDGIISEQWGEDFHYRDQERLDNGYWLEHTLMDNGPKLLAYAEREGFRLTQEGEKDYGMIFTEEGAPQGGEDAGTITLSMKLSNRIKDTILTYSEELDAYTMNQYEMDMVDGYYDVPETYKNIFVLYCDYVYWNVYHLPTLTGEGEGYFACDGKIVPITWHRAGDYDPFTFTLADGTQVEQGIGNSYIALAPTGSEIQWQ